MADHPPLPWVGGCRCDRVRIRVTAPPLLTMACHCTGCQRMSASAFSLSMAIPTAGFEITRGTTVVGGLHGPQSIHHHCEHCKAWMFTRIEPDMGFVNVRPTMLDAARWFEPFVETYRLEALPWAKTPARHSYDKFPPFEDYARLTKEFAAIW